VTSNQPLINVIIPVYNGAAFLAETIESIQQQAYEPLEIIIVDDGSTDESAEIAHRYKGIRYTYQSNRGPATARNTGLRLAQGDIIGFLDQDDLWPANKLSLQVPILLKDPTLEVVLGRTQAMRLTSTANGKREFVPFLGPRVHMLLSCALFRKSVFDKLGLFDETLQYYNDDLDWFMRAREVGISMIMLNEVTLFWRMHEENTSRDRLVRDHALTEVLKRSLDRRRQQNVETVPKFSDFSEAPPNPETSAG
jgi:glycosyltransferase involved in cell wall biosynthesis